MRSYIFENKEDKQADTKNTKNKDDKAEGVAKDRVIARLQVCFTSYLGYTLFYL